jgi:hypothetical protein
MYLKINNNYFTKELFKMDCVQTAKLIRAELKTLFPYTKFSVRSDRYSMGSSVYVKWTDFPTNEEVEKVIGKYERVSRDEYTGEILCGGNMFVNTSHSWTDETKAAIEEDMKQNENNNWDFLQENYYWYSQAFKESSDKLYKIWLTEKEPKKAIKQTEKVNNQTIGSNDNITVELIHNEEKNGLELKFNGIPNEGTRTLLKENGYKWSKYNKVWYCKQSETALLFAESFVSAYNEPIENEETEQPITNEVPEAEQILITESELIGRKVFGQWGVMAGWNYGIITGETIYNKVIIKWEDWEEETGNDNYTLEIKDLVYVTDNTNLDAIGVYLLPIEYNEQENTNDNPEPVTEETTNETTYNQDGKIKVKSIQFLWSESGYIQDNQIVNTFSEAEQLIHNASLNAPKDGCYDKTKFTITWTDGQTYTGRIDIQYKHSATIKPLQSHIISFAKSVIEDDGSFHNDEERESYKQFLDTYSLSDDQPEQPTNKGKVLDFNSKFKQRQAENERQQALNYFTDNILPYLSYDDKMRLLEAQEDKEKFNIIMYELMLKSKAERLKHK